MIIDLFRKHWVPLFGFVAAFFILLFSTGCSGYTCHNAGVAPESDFYDMTQGSLRILWNFVPEQVREKKSFEIQIILQDTSGKSLPTKEDSKIYLRPSPDGPVWIAAWDDKRKVYSSSGSFSQSGRKLLGLEFYTQSNEKVNAEIPVMVRTDEHEDHGNFRGGNSHGGGGLGSGGSCH